jgi:hypothetical protein
MASEALVVCGKHTCDWESLSRLVQFLQKHSISTYIGSSNPAARVMVDYRIRIQKKGYLTNQSLSSSPIRERFTLRIPEISLSRFWALFLTPPALGSELIMQCPMRMSVKK